jgi:hypothetical protein
MNFFRLTNFSEWELNLIKLEEEEKKEEENINIREKWLSLFRLLLALVQHEPSILCQCMNHNLEKIVNCNKMLHNATEEALWFFLLKKKFFYNLVNL